MAEPVDKPLINMESAINHPCQALADWKTLDDLAVPSGARSSCCPGSTTRARCRSPCPPPRCTWPRMRGMEVVVLRPEGYALPRRSWIEGGARPRPLRRLVRETTDRADALKGAQVIYAKEWGSTRTTATPRATASCARQLSDWCVRNAGSTTHAPEARFMHCLPVRRNVAVADEVLDGPRSVVQREAYNRITVADGRAAQPAPPQSRATEKLDPRNKLR
jgi:N-acetylornithine carbamoyltransferase